MRPLAVCALAAAVLLGARPIHAITVDGNLDALYGPPLVLQSTASTMKGYPDGQANESLGEELDGAYGFVSGGVLHLFLAGNLSFWWTLQGQTEWLPVDIFIDCVPGGEHQLLANNPAPDPSYNLNNLAGLTFEAGFAADYWLSVGGNAYTFPHIQAYYGTLPTAGGGAGTFLGSTTAGTPGPLAGGSNPYGFQLALNDSNTAGVASGCGAASGAGVASGIEWDIPLAAIGNPTGCINVCAFTSSGDHAHLLNQVLGPLPPGTCNLGAAATVDFSSIPGSQYFTICEATPTARSTWGRLKAIYR